MPLSVRLGERPAIGSLAGASYSIDLLHQPILGYGSEWLHGALSPLAAFALLFLGAGVFCFFLSLAMDRLVARLEGRLAPREPEAA